MSGARHLNALAPGLEAVAPPAALVARPTPVEDLPELAARWGAWSLAIKRDDRTSAAYGGSKVRALEYLLGAAVAEGARMVATVGPTGSHHLVATTVHARALGLATRAVVFPQPGAPEIGANDAAVQALATEVLRARTVLALPLAVAQARLRPFEGRRPRWIAAGGASALGTLGVAEGALEVADAVRAGAIACPEDVVLAAGSCGTAAGLLLGFSIADLPVRIVAVRIVPRIVARKARIRALAARGLEILERGGFERAVRWRPLAIAGTEIGGGYGVSTAAGAAAAADAGAALPVDSTYTAKALAWLARGGGRGRRVLFWSTLSAVPAPSPEAAAVGFRP